MPIDYGCGECGLRFSVGWYHHGGLESGFGSSTLAVCKRCGRQHRIESAVDVSNWLPWYSYFDVAITAIPASARLAVASQLREKRSLSPQQALAFVSSLPIALAQDVPTRVASDLQTEYEGLGAVVTLTETRREEVKAPPQQRDRLLVAEPDTPESRHNWRPLDVRGPVEGITATFKLEEQACGECFGIGTLVISPAEVPTVCPRCHDSIRDTGGWVT